MRHAKRTLLMAGLLSLGLVMGCQDSMTGLDEAETPGLVAGPAQKSGAVNGDPCPTRSDCETSQTTTPNGAYDVTNTVGLIPATWYDNGVWRNAVDGYAKSEFIYFYSSSSYGSWYHSAQAKMYKDGSLCTTGSKRSGYVFYDGSTISGDTPVSAGAGFCREYTGTAHTWKVVGTHEYQYSQEYSGNVVMNLSFSKTW